MTTADTLSLAIQVYPYICIQVLWSQKEPKSPLGPMAWGPTQGLTTPGSPGQLIKCTDSSCPSGLQGCGEAGTLRHYRWECKTVQLQGKTV